jgi:ribonucleoside-diphosphate reductase alpha chain
MFPGIAPTPATSHNEPPVSKSPSNAHEGAPTCSECGMLMVPNGACYKCENCGSTSGCS